MVYVRSVSFSIWHLLHLFVALVKNKIDTLINFYENHRTQPAHTGTRTIANGIWETEWDGNEEKTGRERRPEKYTPSENKSVTRYTHTR